MWIIQMPIILIGAIEQRFSNGDPQRPLKAFMGLRADSRTTWFSASRFTTSAWQHEQDNEPIYYKAEHGSPAVGRMCWYSLLATHFCKQRSHNAPLSISWSEHVRNSLTSPRGCSGSCCHLWSPCCLQAAFFQLLCIASNQRHKTGLMLKRSYNLTFL